MTFRPFEPVGDDYTRRDFHAVSTVTWNELAEAGFIDWTDPAWAWDYYDPEQKARLEQKMARRFALREISIVPPALWREQFLGKLNELMAVARHMYLVLEKAPNPLVAGDEYHKARNIWSDFPQTLLNGSSGDYASTGTDTEYETVRDRGLLEAMEALQTYKDPDTWILDHLDVMFSCLVSVEISGF